MIQTNRFKVDKLIRDKLPEIIERENGTSLECSILNDKEYLVALKAKLVEEAIEAQDAKMKEELIDEVADVMEVIDSILNIYGISSEEIQNRQKNHQNERGGFSKKIYCHSVAVSDENPTRLAYYRARPDKYPEVK